MYTYRRSIIMIDITKYIDIKKGMEDNGK